MLELGNYSKQEHTYILQLLEELNPTEVFLVGSGFLEVATKFRFNTFSDVHKLNKYLENNPIKNGNILIKGSRGIQLEKVLDFLN